MPLTLIRPRPLAQKATAVASFFLPNTCTDCFGFSALIMKGSEGKEERCEEVSQLINRGLGERRIGVGSQKPQASSRAQASFYGEERAVGAHKCCGVDDESE